MSNLTYPLPPIVIILLTPSTSAFVNTVCGKLASKLGLAKNIFIRSSQIPLSMLIGEETNDSKVYISFEATENLSRLAVESNNPLIILDTYFAQHDSDMAALHIGKICALSGNVELRGSIERMMKSRRQEALINDATYRTDSPAYRAAIATCYDDKMQITGKGVLARGEPGIQGKVRDRFVNDNRSVIALVTTDRQSGFDRQLALVPFKGAVLNMCSSFWFEQTKDIIGNHLLSTPHPYVSIARQCKPFPIEFVVR